LDEVVNIRRIPPLTPAIKKAGIPHHPAFPALRQILQNDDEIEMLSKVQRTSNTMIYARAHDQTVAEDYFAATQRVEQRLEIVSAQQKVIEVVKVREPEKVLQLIEQLEISELCFEERLDITLQLRVLFGVMQELKPAMDLVS
jgi:hypothetical protein